jgi:alkanesulfonate monooxygenase SsuD/methylene tetrahydromethanopterin reductase-like flavin-dependent oxidoreductase (luciferase family)
MEVGLFFTFRNPPPWRRDPARLYADCMEQVRLTDDAGFDGVWLGEHHFTDDGFAPSLMTLAAAIAVATRRVQIGTDVLLLPQHHPVRLAEAAATVDLLSDGRLVLGMGLGYRPSEFSAVGLDYHRRGALMDEALEILVKCFTEDVFSFDGRHYQLSDVSLSPRPVQTPMPRLVLGGSGERMLRRAARFGCSGLAVTPAPALLARHAELVAEYGGDPDAQRYYGMTMGFVAATEEEAWTVAEQHATWELDHYNTWFQSAGLPKIFPNGPRRDFVIGTPERWIAAVDAQLHGAVPLRCDHLVVELTTSGMAHADVMRGIELFAAEVLPALHAM